MIEKVNWDSDFFGYNVGKVNFACIDNYKTFLKTPKNDFKLIYIFTKLELELENHKFKKVDNKLTFWKKIQNKKIIADNNSIKQVKLCNENLDSILQLAYLSGIYSRFNLDENFKNNEFKKLYKIWVINTSQKNILAKYVNGEILGFVVYSINKLIIKIELISVSEIAQGQGIASELIQEIENIGQQNNCKTIEVVTQGINLPAVNLYKKNNFIITNSILIYHFWNI